MFVTGDRVKVKIDNDNYDDIKGKVLTIIGEYWSHEEHPAYDISMRGDCLYEFEDEEGHLVDYALYTYEIEYAL